MSGIVGHPDEEENVTIERPAAPAAPPPIPAFELDDADRVVVAGDWHGDGTTARRQIERAADLGIHVVALREAWHSAADRGELASR